MIPAPKILQTPDKKLIGMRLKMSFAEDRTSDLWRSFLPRIKEIGNRLNTDRICLQAYDEVLPYENFSPQMTYEKWAAVEVSDFENIPEMMESFTLLGGLYAVFRYQGRPDEYPPVAAYIYQTWLPNSGYTLDHSPHFEVMGLDYSPFDPMAEEDIWVPIRTNA